MNKTNNKGFSLVELIVVIAIMAVLIGVMAPALIGNIEKSRESNDFNTLDAVYQAVKTAYGDEAGNKAAKKYFTAAAPSEGATPVVTPVLLTTILADADETGTSANMFAKLVDEYLDGKDPNGDLTSDGATVANAKIYVIINGGKITVWIGTSASTEDSAICKTVKTLDEQGNVKDFLVGTEFDSAEEEDDEE